MIIVGHDIYEIEQRRDSRDLDVREPARSCRRSNCELVLPPIDRTLRKILKAVDDDTIIGDNGTIDRLRDEHPDITHAVGQMLSRLEQVEIIGNVGEVLAFAVRNRIDAHGFSLISYRDLALMLGHGARM